MEPSNQPLTSGVSKPAVQFVHRIRDDDDDDDFVFSYFLNGSGLTPSWESSRKVFS